MNKRIDPHRIYTLSEVESIFDAEWETIQNNLNLNLERRVFRGCVMGLEIIAAYEKAMMGKCITLEPKPVKPKKRSRKIQPKPKTARTGLQPISLSDMD